MFSVTFSQSNVPNTSESSYEIWEVSEKLFENVDKWTTDAKASKFL